MNQAFIEKKLELLGGYLSEIDPIISRDLTTLMEDKMILRSLERIFQLIVDTAIDINRSFIESAQTQVPDSYQGTFYTMGDLGILDPAFANRIAPSVGLRNRIVHRYDDIQLRVMIESIKKLVPMYGEYKMAILQKMKDAH